MSFAVTAVAALAYTVYSGERAAKAQASAQAQAKAAAQAQADAADQATNRANQKKPDTAAALSAAAQSGASGVSSTLLTGPAGVTLPLGKSTLLGG